MDELRRYRDFHIQPSIEVRDDGFVESINFVFMEASFPEDHEHTVEYAMNQIEQAYLGYETSKAFRREVDAALDKLYEMRPPE